MTALVMRSMNVGMWTCDMVLQGTGVDTGAAACPVSIVYCWLNRELSMERECLCLLEACE